MVKKKSLKNIYYYIHYKAGDTNVQFFVKIGEFWKSYFILILLKVVVIFPFC